MEVQTTVKSKFKKLWKYYILQSLLATIVLFILVLVLGRYKLVTISAMGATTFIVFAMPKAVTAKTRNVIGGHLVGLPGPYSVLLRYLFLLNTLLESDWHFWLW
ncbi:MAG: HPP family protein [Planctomycetota bacterium]|jgi:CBS-domain-containing membrane protein